MEPMGEAFLEVEDGERADDEDDAVSGVAVDVDVVLVPLASPPSELRAETLHVRGSTASSDVRLKPGVLRLSTPARSSSCMWQLPFSS